MAVIGFLHAAETHRETFARLVAEASSGSIEDLAEVAPGLLAAARSTSPDDPAVVTGVEEAIAELRRRGADSIVCTCSTLGAVAEAVGREVGVDVVRVDRAMAERAIELGGVIIVLAALDSTLAPTEELLRSVGGSRGLGPSTTDIRLAVVPGAWERFEAGDVDRYHALVADAIERAGDEADVIVLAQASMAPAAALVSVTPPVLSSPALAVEAAVARLVGGERRVDRGPPGAVSP